MESSSINKAFRKRLRITRFLNAYLPLSLMSFIIKKSVNRTKLPDGIKREEIFANNVRCEWIIPQNFLEDKILLYLHGGGFILGLTSLHLEMIAYLVQRLGIRSLVVDYRLAPKYPFPASLNDCVMVYRWLLENGYKPENIVLAGDSAGGNLVITSLIKLRDEGTKLPAAIACLSPVANLAKREESIKIKYDPVLHPRASKRFNQSYIGDNDPTNPLLSPIYGELKNFPPMLIHAGENEILKNDAIQIEQKARSSGVDVHLEIFPGMWHVWQIYLSLPEAIQSLDKISTFLKANLN